jgi:hypothetical protein
LVFANAGQPVQGCGVLQFEHPSPLFSDRLASMQAFCISRQPSPSLIQVFACCVLAPLALVIEICWLVYRAANGNHGRLAARSLELPVKILSFSVPLRRAKWKLNKKY